MVLLPAAKYEWTVVEVVVLISFVVGNQTPASIGIHRRHPGPFMTRVLDGVLFVSCEIPNSTHTVST